MADAEYFGGRAEVRAEIDLGAWYICPLHEWKLVDQAIDGSTAFLSRHRDQSGENLHVKGPCGSEGLLEEAFEPRRDPKEFRPALRIVNPHVQHQRNDGGEDAAHQMAGGSALDSPTQQFYTRAKDHVEVGTRFEEPCKVRDI